jgi:hypothetical protein
MTAAIARQWRWQAAFVVVVALALWSYWPGLTGEFLFDDFVNLDALSRHGAVVDGPSFWRYITSGTADPIGRPLSLLSFLADARDWPAEPASFLATNLFLHLFNGALLFVLLGTIERTLGTDPSHRMPIALLGAGAWLLHPLFVSTTLYAVQREAMLPATCALLGLLAFAWGMEACTRHGLVAAYGGLALSTVAAILCKANGMLVPLLAWVLFTKVMRSSHRSTPAHLIFLVMPSLVVLTYVAHFAFFWNTVDQGRTWTIGERFWTQGRVLLDYLGLLTVPRVLSPGLFIDGYAASGGAFAPVTSLLGWLVVIVLCLGAVKLGNRVPRLSAAILFFFAGHLLESTLVPLELFFEHRNYLPALMLFWPLASAIVQSPLARWVRATIGVALLALLATTTHARADAWGHPARLAALWVTRNPDSARAHAMWTEVTISSGFPDRAAAWLRPRWRAAPRDLQLGASVIDAACAGKGLAPGDAQAMTRAFRTANQAGALAQDWLAFRIDLVHRKPCIGLTPTVVAHWLGALESNPYFSLRGTPMMSALRGRLALQQGDADAALVLFDRAYAVARAPDMLLRQAALLDANGATVQALRHLDRFDPAQPDPRTQPLVMPRLHALVLAHQHYWQREVLDLRARIAAQTSRLEDPTE